MILPVRNRSDSVGELLEVAELKRLCVVITKVVGQVSDFTLPRKLTLERRLLRSHWLGRILAPIQ